MIDELEKPVEEVYSILSGDDDSDRACKAIPDDACKHEPKNYLLNVLNGSATKLAEQLAGPNLVLPWLLSVLNVPAFLIGFLMPVKQTGSLLPQLFVAGQIRKYKIRKWFWVSAGITQAVMLLLMVLSAAFFSPVLAGIAIVILLALFSIASGVGSVAFQDVAGKTIDKGVRGHMLANRATIGGVLTIAAGIVVKSTIKGSEEVSSYFILFFIAAGLWVFGALVFSFMKETSGASDGGKNAIDEAKFGFKLYKEVKGYRTYLFSRALLLSIEIATPFYVIHSRKILTANVESLGILVVSVGLAKVLSSPFWGKFSDVSSRKVLIISGLMGAFTGIVALIIGFLPEQIQSPYLYGIVFLLIGFSESGVRLGRKTYLIDATTQKNRATYVAFGNSIIGVITIISGLIGLIAQYISIDAVIILLIALGILGSLISLNLPEASEMIKS